MQDITKLLDVHSVCTFRFYAQHAKISAAEAKEALRSYAEANEGKVHVVHLLGGFTKGDSGLQYKLVKEEQLEAAKEQFETVTACHPYSVHAAPATSDEPLFILNHSQERSLYDKVRNLPCYAARKKNNCAPTVTLVPQGPS